MEKYFHDFDGDELLITSYKFFVDGVIAQHEGERLSKQLAGLFEKPSTNKIYVANRSPPTPIIPRSDSFTLMEIDPIEVFTS